MSGKLMYLTAVTAALLLGDGAAAREAARRMQGGRA